MEITTMNMPDMLPTSSLPKLLPPFNYILFTPLGVSPSVCIEHFIMVIPASDVVITSPKYIKENMVEIDDEADIYLSAEHFLELNMMVPEETKTLVREESQEKEKQISVDPISLRESSRRDSSFNLMLPLPIITTQDLPVPPPLPPLKSQLVSCSLPNSAVSSQRFSFALLKKKWRNESQASPRQIDNLAHRHSAVHPQISPEDIHLRRSKSCAEGRSSAPTDELDLMFINASAIEHNNKTKNHGTFHSELPACKTAKKIDPNSDDGFKCSALCLYLPGFGRAKPVRSKREEVEIEETEMEKVISRTVSLEKFECGSWASSAIINDLHDDGDASSINLYFDLPPELIKTSKNETDSPVAAAFVFDRDRIGVLKNSSTKATRKSHESSRHVRFSTSSSTSHPTSPASCITPRLRKAREDFNAFLEAQSS